jgi:hypothetical protein
LGITNNVDDAEVMGFVRSASYIVNHLSGYTVATTFTEWANISPLRMAFNSMSGYVPIMVDRTPVVSVTSIVPQFYNASPVSLTGLVIDNEAGILYLSASSLFLGPCLVTYTAGRSVVPSTLQMACRIIVQGLWDTQRGPAMKPDMGLSDDMVRLPDIAWPIPRQAMELITMSPYKAAPGFA